MGPRTTTETWKRAHVHPKGQRDAGEGVTGCGEEGCVVIAGHPGDVMSNVRTVSGLKLSG